MPVMLGGDKAWKQRVLGDIVISYQWINGEPAMILFPKKRPTLESGAFAVALSAAFQYVKSNGDPDLNYIMPQAFQAAKVMGFFPDKAIITRIIDAITDGIPDLVEMPPIRPGYDEQKSKEVIGEMNIKQDGRVIRTEEITVPDSLEVSYGND